MAGISSDEATEKHLEFGLISSQMNLLCSNCGLTWGAHRANPRNATCPGHEGRMDFDEGPGTVFRDSGVSDDIEKDTPARRLFG